jgi:beta-lactamase superfamily II metal-dependent hydrolase
MLRITFINVGYGDSILLEEFRDSARKFTMLVDAGSPFEDDYRLAYEAGPERTPAFRYLASRGIDKLDLIFLTHFHIDHVGGMPAVMRKNPFGEVWTNFRLADPISLPNRETPFSKTIDHKVHFHPGGAPESVAMRRSLRLLGEMEEITHKAGKEIMPVSSTIFGRSLTSELTADFYAVAPALYANMDRLSRIAGEGIGEEEESALIELDKTQNASCAALRLHYRGRSILLAADLPYPYWDSLIEGGHPPKADILKFPHHGHEDGVSPALARAIVPEHVIFCVSEDNPFGCPKPAAFSPFPEGVSFYATGGVGALPLLVREPSSPALVFEISDDDSIVRLNDN